MKPLPSLNIKVPAPIAAQTLTWRSAQSVCLSAILLLIALMQPAGAESGKILKWKDDKGTTHYGDRIPPQYANRESTSMSPQGIVIKRNKPVNNQDLSVDIAKQDQDKKDKALLNAFTNENEIDLARDRNLQGDLITLENLQLEKSAAQKRLVDTKKSIDNLAKQKKKIPANLSADLANNQVANASLEQRINERKLAIENTRMRFENDKQRYIALKNNTAENVAPAEALAPDSQSKPAPKPVSSGDR